MVELFIGVGSNRDREKHLHAGVRALQQLFTDVTLSPVYEAEAVGLCGANYYNLVVRCRTSLPLAEVHAALHTIEQHWGRRAPQNRDCCTLDLDLLMYGQQCHVDKPQLPRPDIMQYAFVLRPLAELAPEVTHPQNGLSFAALWESFDDPSQRLWPVNVVWDFEDSSMTWDLNMCCNAL